jgi:hypothetical protein
LRVKATLVLRSSYLVSRATTAPLVSQRHLPGREKGTRRARVYIGIGTLVFILLVLLIIYLVRRA